MRGKRAKLAAAMAEYDHTVWRKTSRVNKYKRNVKTGQTICHPVRRKYKAFKAFIKLQRKRRATL